MENKLQLVRVEISEDYRKKWNIHQNDFRHLYNNGNLLRGTLYRTGGFWVKENINKDYFLLLKYTEDIYDDSITKDIIDKLYLNGQWCIIDKNGNERVVFKKFENPYLVKDSILYSIESKYYNIETGEFYGYCYNSMQSKDSLFLDSSEKCGVLKINKKDGSYEVFKK